MGLDIYLKQYEDFDDTRRRQDEWEEYSEKLWDEAGAYDELSDEEKEEISKKEKEKSDELNLGKYGQDEDTVETIEIDHDKYPEHLFKVGYFRSSYNGSGLNRLLSNQGLPTLHDIFETEGSDYYVRPDWEKALAHSNELLEELKVIDLYRVRAFNNNPFKSEFNVESEEDALDVFKKELERESSFSSYSNSDGSFYKENPLQVLAVIEGVGWPNNTPTQYVIHRYEDDKEWIVKAIEIVRDTCEFVLGHENTDNFILHWSG